MLGKVPPIRGANQIRQNRIIILFNICEAFRNHFGLRRWNSLFQAAPAAAAPASPVPKAFPNPGATARAAFALDCARRVKLPLSKAKRPTPVGQIIAANQVPTLTRFPRAQAPTESGRRTAAQDIYRN